MLSLFRSRSPRSSPPRAALRDAQWDGYLLTLMLDDVAAGDRVALDLDGCFFADAAVDNDRVARFAFPFAPQTGAFVHGLPRLRRDGDALADAPLAMRFGVPGMGEDVPSGAAQGATSDILGNIGRGVPFGIDCSAREVAIVVPVYDAPELVARCLESVIAHTTGRARLIVIDDASPDPAVAPLLERYAARARVRVLRNERNLGFTATANRGIVEAGRADVVLLNADTEVGPHWLTGLRRAIASRDDVATATAVSDNAGAFSVPELERENVPPATWTFEQAVSALWQHAGRAYPELPTGNGFCMYIRREVIDAVGALDEAAFPQGYGEENDFCQRASAEGFRHLVAGNVYVRHARSASFGHERRAALGAVGMAVLRERWPNYEADVAASLYSFERRVLDWRVRRLFSQANAAMPVRVLTVGDVALAGVESWRLHVDRGSGDFQRDENGAASSAVQAGNDATPRSLDEQIWISLQTLAIEAVVADADFPGALPRLAAALGIPFVRVERGQSALSALASALDATRSFADAAR